MPNCKDTWDKTVTVRAKLDNGFDAGLTRKLKPVGKPPSDWGRGRDDEKKLVASIKSERLRIHGLLDGNSRVLAAVGVNGADNREALRADADEALEHLEEASHIYKAWREREGGIFPLSAADSLATFEIVNNLPAGTCKMPGQYIPGGEYGTGVRCPSETEMYFDREAARKKIRQQLEDAAGRVRCAEYKLWRTVLHHETVQEWNEAQVEAKKVGFVPKKPTVVEYIPPPPPGLAGEQEPGVVGGKKKVVTFHPKEAADIEHVPLPVPEDVSGEREPRVPDEDVEEEKTWLLWLGLGGLGALGVAAYFGGRGRRRRRR